MTIPVDTLAWASLPTSYDVITGFPNKIEPPLQFKDSGLASSNKAGMINQPLPANFLNYQFNLLAEWIEHLGGLYPLDTVKSFSANMLLPRLTDMFGGTWLYMGLKLIGSTASAGFQDAHYDRLLTLDMQHGLTSGVAYTASVDINGGGAQAVSYTPATNTETISDLITAFDVDVTNATLTIAGDRLRVITDATGAGKTVAITDTNLFSSITDYNSISTAIDGAAANHNVTLYKRVA